MPIDKERDLFYMENNPVFGVAENPCKPKHYHTSNDVYQFCLDNDLGGLEMNVIKYVSRWKKKNGIEDLRKARETLDRLIQYNVE